MRGKDVLPPGACPPYLWGLQHGARAGGKAHAGAGAGMPDSLWQCLRHAHGAVGQLILAEELMTIISAATLLSPTFIFRNSGSVCLNFRFFFFFSTWPSKTGCGKVPNREINLSLLMLFC